MPHSKWAYICQITQKDRQQDKAKYEISCNHKRDGVRVLERSIQGNEGTETKD